VKATPLLLGILLASCASTAAQRPPPERPNSKFDVYLGVRSLDEDDWAPVEDQGTLGLEYVHEHPADLVGFELGLFASGNTKHDVQIGGGTFDVRGRTTELSVGLRKTFCEDPTCVTPYVGAGLSLIRADFKGASGGSSAEDDDSSAGIYAHGGIDIPLGPGVTIGLDLRLLGGTDITLFGVNGTADYGQIALVLGVRF